MVVQIKSGKRENEKSFWCNLYRKRSNGRISLCHRVLVEDVANSRCLREEAFQTRAHLVRLADKQEASSAHVEPGQRRAP